MKSQPTSRADRRRFLTAALTAAAAAPLAARAAQAPASQGPPPATPPAGGPPPVSPVPTSRAWDAAEPRMYPDPDIVALDPAFRSYVVFNSLIKRLHFGTSWAEGPAWNGVGRYMVWSDIPANVQMRWIEDDNRVTTFRNPSNNSNGNTFDFEGRQLSCEHGGRRVVRYEPNGQVTVIADTFEGKRLNSPNDVVVHPDGSIWFTDPSYGIRGNYEGNKAASETKEAVYRVDPKTAAIARVAMGDQNQPNGLCFSPDYKKLYVADGAIWVYDVDGATLKNGKQFVQPMVPGHEPTERRRRHPLRHRRQRVGRRPARRPRVLAGRPADRDDPPARGVREHLLRRRQAEPPVHGRQPVPLRGLRRGGRRPHRLTGLAPAAGTRPLPIFFLHRQPWTGSCRPSIHVVMYNVVIHGGGRWATGRHSTKRNAAARSC